MCVDILDLINNTCQPYQKPNSETVNVSKHWKHPPNISKELPKAVNKRIIGISLNQHIFDAAKTTYEQALHKSFLNKKLKYYTNIVRSKIGNKK